MFQNSKILILFQRKIWILDFLKGKKMKKNNSAVATYHTNSKTNKNENV